MKQDSLLIIASREGDIDKVKLLIDQGADINARDDQALRWASNNGHLDVVKLLKDKGGDN